MSSVTANRFFLEDGLITPLVLVTPMPSEPDGPKRQSDQVPHCWPEEAV